MAEGEGGEGADAATAVAHVNVLSDGSDPAPTALVAIEMHKVTQADQLSAATEFFDFLTNPTSNLLELNTDDVLRTAVISIPNSSKVKVVYSGGLGCSGIGRTSMEDGNFLFLNGDGGRDIGTPTSMSLPATIRVTNTVAVMTPAQLSTKLIEKGPTYQWPILVKDKVTTTKDIMQIAPLPPFLVYDGLNSDIDAALLYERVLDTDTTGLPVYQHAKDFLLACLSKHNMADLKPFVDHHILLQHPSVDARRWANNRFKSHFPLLLPQPFFPLPPAPPPLPPPDIAAQIAAYMAATRGNGRGYEEEKKDNDETTLLSGMSQQELQLTLQMCGQGENGVKEELPKWFLEVAAKGTQDSFKNLIIRKTIETNTIYDDAEVPLTSQLVKMISKRSWCGKESNTRRPSILNATEGLSPFIVSDLDEDEVAKLNFDADAITTASHTTVEDILKLRNKAKVKIPETAEKFMLLLRTYANLLFALFSKECPYLKCVVKIIDALKQFSRAARDAMSLTTRASILWVILLQGRQFATGHMDILAEFSSLHTNLISKQANIYHAEVPAELLQSKLSKKRSLDPSADKDKPGSNKKYKPDAEGEGTNPNTWHPKLRKKMDYAIRKTNFPRFMQILNYCGINADEVYSKYGNRCTPNTLFGFCSSRSHCTRSHKLPTDIEADEIIELTKKFHEQPENFKKGPS